jgi:hypothetical protein
MISTVQESLWPKFTTKDRGRPIWTHFNSRTSESDLKLGSLTIDGQTWESKLVFRARAIGES